MAQQNGKGKGGARPGAGRRPKSGLKNFGRYIYVVQEIDAPHACKIGVTVDAYNATSTLQTRHARRLKLVGLFGAPLNSQATEIVTTAKARMAPISTPGEWFRAAVEDVAAQLQYAAQSLGVTLTSEPVREVGGRGGCRAGAGRPKGVPNKGPAIARIANRQKTFQ